MAYFTIIELPPLLLKKKWRKKLFGAAQGRWQQEDKEPSGKIRVTQTILVQWQVHGCTSETGLDIELSSKPPKPLLVEQNKEFC